MNNCWVNETSDLINITVPLVNRIKVSFTNGGGEGSK